MIFSGSMRHYHHELMVFGGAEDDLMYGDEHGELPQYALASATTYPARMTYRKSFAITVRASEVTTKCGQK
jgi:hypothetical protein